MSDFLFALQKGIASAQEALTNHKEIDELIDEVRVQIENYSSGNVTIYKNVDKNLIKVSELLPKKIPKAEDSTYFIGRNNVNSNTNFQKIFRLMRLDDGYPCDLLFSSESAQCFDRGAVSNALAEYLSTQEFGSKLLALM